MLEAGHITPQTIDLGPLGERITVLVVDGGAQSGRLRTGAVHGPVGRPLHTDEMGDLRQGAGGGARTRPALGGVREQGRDMLLD